MSGGLSRRALLAAGAGAAVAAVLPPTAQARSAGDDDLLNMVLALEHLQAALYSEAERRGALAHRGARAAAEIGAIERAHVAALTGALGDAARVPPLFSFGRATSEDPEFVRTAVAAEDLAAAVQLAVLPRLASPRRRALLAGLHTVDAGHAAYLRLTAGVSPVTAALDDPLAPREGVAILRRGHAAPRPGAAPGDPWAAAPTAGPGLLASFPLGRRPVVTGGRAPAPPAPDPAPAADGGLPAWIAWLAATGGLSALVVGGLAVRARRLAGRVTVVGPDVGPEVVQQAAAPRRVAPEDPAARTAGVPRAGVPRERERV